MSINIFIVLIFFLSPIVYQIVQTIRRLRNKTTQGIGFTYLMTISLGVIFSLLSSLFFMKDLLFNKSKEPMCVTGIETAPLLFILAIFIFTSLIAIIALLIKYFLALVGR